MYGQCLGRLKGGFTTKLHPANEGLGLPLLFKAGAGQEHDMKQAIPLVKACSPAEYVLADKDYDADSLFKAIAETGAEICIPLKSNRLAPHI